MNDKKGDESVDQILSSIRSIVDEGAVPTASQAPDPDDDPIIDLTRTIDKNGRIVELPPFRPSADWADSAAGEIDPAQIEQQIEQQVEKLAVPMIEAWIEEHLPRISERILEERAEEKIDPAAPPDPPEASEPPPAAAPEAPPPVTEVPPRDAPAQSPEVSSTTEGASGGEMISPFTYPPQEVATPHPPPVAPGDSGSTPVASEPSGTESSDTESSGDDDDHGSAGAGRTAPG